MDSFGKGGEGGLFHPGLKSLRKISCAVITMIVDEELNTEFLYSLLKLLS